MGTLSNENAIGIISSEKQSIITYQTTQDVFNNIVDIEVMVSLGFGIEGFDYYAKYRMYNNIVDVNISSLIRCLPFTNSKARYTIKIKEYVNYIENNIETYTSNIAYKVADNVINFIPVDYEGKDYNQGEFLSDFEEDVYFPGYPFYLSVASAGSSYLYDYNTKIYSNQLNINKESLLIDFSDLDLSEEGVFHAKESGIIDNCFFIDYWVGEGEDFNNDFNNDFSNITLI